MIGSLVGARVCAVTSEMAKNIHKVTLLGPIITDLTYGMHEYIERKKKGRKKLHLPSKITQY